MKQRRHFSKMDRLIVSRNRTTLGEEIANSVTHGIGVILGIVALVLMVLRSDTGIKMFASLVFSIGMINMYVNSTLYHAFTNRRIKFLFKKFDHLSIYILIAASYTPYLILLLYKYNNNRLGLYLFIVQWVLVVIGVTAKSIWINRFEKMHLAIFITMGWMAVFMVGYVRNYNVHMFNLLLAGGICYTVGAVIYATKAFKFHHMIWHLFVFAGSLCHFLSVYMFLLR